MSKGELPTPYIVALVFAVIIIAVLAYMFFTHTGLFSGTVSKSECEAVRIKYCLDWQMAGADKPPGGGWDMYKKGCTEIGVTASKDDCASLGIQIS
jgi:hypothetical protein